MQSLFAKYNNIFNELSESARIAVLTESERKDYDKLLKIYRDKYAIAMTERRLGKEEGRAEGREEGRAEDRAEVRRMIAMSMLESGVDVYSVSKYTGLAVDDVLSLNSGSNK
ncbi:MAG: hypothetical protein HDR88_15845 [Bacteroides sp.]|nr:hypothetical protein [Bacteroides sp.]